MRPAPGRGSPWLEAVAKLGPIIFFVTMAVVLSALAVNYLQARRHPELQTRFEPTKEFSRVNARGMVNLVLNRDEGSNSGRESF